MFSSDDQIPIILRIEKLSIANLEMDLKTKSVKREREEDRSYCERVIIAGNLS